MGGTERALAARRIARWVLLFALACATTGAPALLAPELLLPLEKRAEQARGLRFYEPTEARLVSREALDELLEDAITRVYTPDLVRADERVKKAVGLLPEQADLWGALLEFQSDAVVGFYAPRDEQLYVVAGPGEGRGGDLLGTDVDQVLIHELIHVLQARHTDLIDVTLGLIDHDDLGFALGALLEGDATWAGYRDASLSYGLPMPSPAQMADEFEANWSEDAFRDVPRVVREGFVLQYPTGYALVTRIVDAGGIAALDAALLDPPLTSEELLHPERYLDPFRREPLLFLRLEEARIAPSPDCEIVGGNTFGEFGLRVWAQERRMGASAAAVAAAGWDADRAVVFDCPSGPAFAWLVQFESEAKAREFAGMAREVARPSTHVDELGVRVLLSSNLEEDGREAALRETESEVYAALSAYLKARPEILTRARELRGR
jgi:hypothetical protein